jgi:excinuclease UvrABC nuclease subunit
MSIFRNLVKFDSTHVLNVPSAPGVYIIYNSLGEPIYVGRSRVNINDRLRKHVMGKGNRGIADLLTNSSDMWFEYSEMMSPEQAEAQLIAGLGTKAFGNLRGETDPADKF